MGWRRDQHPFSKYQLQMTDKTTLTAPMFSFRDLDGWWMLLDELVNFWMFDDVLDYLRLFGRVVWPWEMVVLFSPGEAGSFLLRAQMARGPAVRSDFTTNMSKAQETNWLEILNYGQIMLKPTGFFNGRLNQKPLGSTRLAGNRHQAAASDLHCGLHWKSPTGAAGAAPAAPGMVAEHQHMDSFNQFVIKHLLQLIVHDFRHNIHVDVCVCPDVFTCIVLYVCIFSHIFH